MDKTIEKRPTLHLWLDEYEAIETEYLDALNQHGVLFAQRNADEVNCSALKRQLRARGALFLNGGASISTGFLSSACAACVGDCGSRTFYINLRCDQNCYFCFNPNQADFQEHCAHDTPWRDDVDAFCRERNDVSHIALTGGEPLLCRDEAIAFFEHAHRRCPEAHLRLYTSGIGLDETTCKAFAAAGLREIRFSVKLENGEAAVRAALQAIKLAQHYIPDVMVEMPVVPGTLERMKQLLVELDEQGVCGINLLEFCFPFRNWSEFERRGFQIKNPPFRVLYDYGYAGGLPVAGSEEEGLKLLVYALDQGLSLGIHYCSLENKNCDQILQQNRGAALDPALYELGEDAFYKTAKVFDGDVAVMQQLLDERGHAYQIEEDGLCLVFHPSLCAEAAQKGAVPALSWNVAGCNAGELVVRELKLQVWDEEDC